MEVTCGPENNRQTFTLTVPEGRQLAIMLSSGADSAILLYMICTELMRQSRSTDEIKYIFTVPKTDGAEAHSPSIVSAINEMLNINLPMPTIFGAEAVQTLHHSNQILESIRAVFNKYDPDRNNLFLYLADNRAVSELVLNPEEQPYRVAQNPYPELLGLPFNDLLKCHTIDLHFIHGTERLLELSHSCTQQTYGRCGKCYHCRERQWAFDQLGKTDPGQN
jgi:7-cyano-7-deazaguanine synthase in queuosine biosynthesis